MQKLKELSKVFGISDIIIIGLVLIAVGKTMNKKTAPDTVTEIRNQVGVKTVMLTGSLGGGTGFFVKAPSGDTYIMSNAHVCTLKDSDGMINVNLPNGDKVKRRVLQEYHIHDLCLVENVKGFEGMDVAEELDTGETVYIVGHPKLFPLTISSAQYIGQAKIDIFYGMNTPNWLVPNVPRIRISKKSGLTGMQSLLTSQFVGYSRGGNSGSSIVNHKGEVVSVLFAGNPADNQETYAVPLSYIKTFLKYR